MPVSAPRNPFEIKRLRPFLALVAALLCFAGCKTHKPAPKPIAEDEPPRAVQPGETVSYEFPADGEYHRSPYLALNGQHLLILPDTQSAGLVKDNSIRMAVEKDEIMVGNHQTLRIQTPGPMWFKVSKESRRKWIRSLTVTIQCVD